MSNFPYQSIPNLSVILVAVIFTVIVINFKIEMTNLSRLACGYYFLSIPYNRFTNHTQRHFSESCQIKPNLD